MNVRLVRSLTPLSVCALFVACSGGDSSSARATTAERPDQSGCIDEFVQEYEEVAEHPPTESLGRLCFPEDSPPGGPPKYPDMSRKVRIEYRRGDYFITQDSASWGYEDEPDLVRGCLVPKLVKIRVVAISEDGSSESVRIEGGRTQRSSETGDPYRTRIRLGSPPSDRDDVPGFRITREATPFGRECTRVTQEGGFNSSICAFVQPHTCRSVKVMLPAEDRTLDTSGIVLTGRTTSFETGAVVDKSTWVLP